MSDTAATLGGVDSDRMVPQKEMGIRLHTQEDGQKEG